MMKNQQQFSDNVTNLKAEIEALPELSDATGIQQTASRLEGLHFTPTLILEAPHFLYFSKSDLFAEIDRVTALSEQELQEYGVAMQQEADEIKLEQIAMLVYHYKLLHRLRRDDPEAWDEVDELYGDD